MRKNIGSNTQQSALYGMGLIGALVYYISNAGTFLGGLVGVLKSFVWPAILVYEALAKLGL
ncbi:MAG: hypothetical protein RIC15_02070 [Vicingaceae bacterium]